MSRCLYLDCHSGIAGDMVLGALVDVGADPQVLVDGIAALGLAGARVHIARTFKCGIACAQVTVHDDAAPVERRLSDIEAIVRGAPLPPPVADRAIAVFQELAAAEAHVHGCLPGDVHFHEVGAVDAICDIVGASLLVHSLGPDVIRASPVRTGFGYVRAAHGQMPIPAPATALLLRGLVSYAGPVSGEWTTPTGAALLRAWTSGSERQPPMIVERVGWGAGTRDAAHPNALRAVWGTSPITDAAGQPWAFDALTELTCHVDDMTGAEVGFLRDALVAAGAVDVWTTPVQGKKGRPSVQISALAAAGHTDQALRAFFGHGSTLGVRVQPLQRAYLPRDTVRVQTPWGSVRAKRTTLDGAPRFRPEYEDCALLARAHAVPLRQVWQAAERAMAAHPADSLAAADGIPVDPGATTPRRQADPAQDEGA